MAIEDKIRKIIKEVGDIKEEVQDHFILEDYGFTSIELIDLIARLEDLVDENLDEEPLFEQDLWKISVAEIIDLVKVRC